MRLCCFGRLCCNRENVLQSDDRVVGCLCCFFALFGTVSKHCLVQFDAFVVCFARTCGRGGVRAACARRSCCNRVIVLQSDERAAIGRSCCWVLVLFGTGTVWRCLTLFGTVWHCLVRLCCVSRGRVVFLQHAAALVLHSARRSCCIRRGVRAVRCACAAFGAAFVLYAALVLQCVVRFGHISSVFVCLISLFACVFFECFR